MIVYEVDIEVRDDTVAAYRAWLSAHVDEMLALPGFVSAEIFARREPAAKDGHHAIVVQYRLVDADALTRYLAEHAPRVREDGTRRFGSAFSATRRVLAREAPATDAG